MWEKPTSLSLHAGDPTPTECLIFPNQPADNQNFAPRNYTLKHDNTPAVSHGTRPFKTFFSWFINSYLIDFSNDLQGHSRWGPELELIFIYFYCSSAVVFIFACFPCSTASSDLRVFPPLAMDSWPTHFHLWASRLCLQSRCWLCVKPELCGFLWCFSWFSAQFMFDGLISESEALSHVCKPHRAEKQAANSKIKADLPSRTLASSTSKSPSPSVS